MARKRLFVVDTMAMAFRNFHAFGANPLRTVSGLPTSVVFGSVGFLMRLIEEEKPDYLVMATDSREKTFRHHLYQAYKANRSEMPEDLALQMPYLFELFEAMGLKLLKEGGLEADDLIGSLVTQYAAQGLDCYIVSGDKDFMQLITPQIKLYSPKKGAQVQIIDESGVQAKFGCAPEQVIDILAILGDSSDNVPGVNGIGDKGASELIQKYGSLDGIYANLEQIGNKRQREALTTHREMAYLSKQLVTIKTDATLHFSLEDFAINGAEAVCNSTLLALVEKLEFRIVAEKMAARLQEQRVKLEPQPPRDDINVIRENLNYITANTTQALEWLRKSASQTDLMVFDTETTGLDIINDRPIGASFSFAPNEAWYVPLIEEHLQGVPLSEAVETVKEVLRQPGVLKIGHNTKFDIQMLANLGVEVRGQLADTMIASYLLNSTERSHGLDACVLRHLNYEKIKTSALLKTSGNQATWTADLKQIAEYACEDADFTLRLWQALAPQLEQLGLGHVFWNVEMPLVPVLAQMEQAGIYVDAAALDVFSQQLDVKAKELTATIYQEAGEEFNINSPKQLQVILFEKLKVHEQVGAKRLKKTKSGYSTDVSVLEMLAVHPLPKALLEYRTVTKLKGTYVDALPQLINPKTNRIHTSFHQTGTATGRVSSSDPNLQNIPIRSELGREIRKAFRTADPDWEIVSADYSQVELRLLAHLAHEDNLTAAFAEGADIHTATAAKIFGVEPGSVSKNQRSAAKAINFGLIYGMGPQRLARETGTTTAEAKSFIEKYFASYPRIRTYIDDSIQFAKEHLYTKTITGRRRPLPEIAGKDALALASAQNIAVNSPVQGSAADLIKIAMTRIQKELEETGLRARMLLQVHDELVFECHRDDVAAVMALVKRCMESAMELDVPIVAEVAAGTNWLEAH